MKRLMTIICVLLAFAGLVLVPATAYASPPTTMSGTYAFVSRVVVDVRQADGNTIVEDILRQTLTGTVTGSATFERTTIIHSDGEFNIHGIITSDLVTVIGRSGTYTQLIDATGIAATGAIQGRWVILSGTGELANMRAHGTFEGVAGVTGTYLGQLHFDPQ